MMAVCPCPGLLAHTTKPAVRSLVSGRTFGTVSGYAEALLVPSADGGSGRRSADWVAPSASAEATSIGSGSAAPYATRFWGAPSTSAASNSVTGARPSARTTKNRAPAPTLSVRST